MCEVDYKPVRTYRKARLWRGQEFRGMYSRLNLPPRGLWGRDEKGGSEMPRWEKYLLFPGAGVRLWYSGFGLDRSRLLHVAKGGR
jgi:hypothetical protein